MLLGLYNNAELFGKPWRHDTEEYHTFTMVKERHYEAKTGGRVDIEEANPIYIRPIISETCLGCHVLKWNV